MDHSHTHRRPVILGLAGAAALGAATAATKIAATLTDEDTSGRPRLELSSDSSVGELTVRLGDDLLPATAAGTWRSRELGTSTHSMVGFTWTGPRSPEVHIRSRVRGEWGPWRPAPLMHDEPDAGAAERSATRGTQLLWIGRSDGIDIRVDGNRPRDLALVLLHPRRLRGDARVHPEPGRAGSAGARGRRMSRRRTVTQPAMLTRRKWGADESWRSSKPQYNSTLQQVHVHHSASGNDYSQADVPALLRGFYRYHTKSLRWSDIGYNFLVDKWGRIWVGRYGGPRKLVRGAHTLGFNATSTGVCVIGNYDAVGPTPEIVSAVASIAAWKIAPYGLDPLGAATVTSEGSDKFRARRTVSLPVIDGHRDTNDTACPGGLLYAQLPAIREATRQIVAAGSAPPPPIVEVTPSVISGSTGLGQTLSVTPATFNPSDSAVAVAWTRNGTAIPGATATTYTTTADDVGATLGVQTTATREGYTAATTAAAAPAVVTAVTRLVLKTPRLHRKAAIGVKVRAVGAGVRPGGTVTVQLRKQTATVTLNGKGNAVAKFPVVKPGWSTATITYHGATGFDPSSITAKVGVLRRKRRKRG
ncbi:MULTISPECIES: N-acetylmuramoyl-L-alanine amidase [unclassified Nocardioides]|uniref:N-acetylmuramoyl-L-alanine amidase n=1 Tax=unclassified Nocardioides TaxID=2615069 RepID=UPI0036071681